MTDTVTALRTAGKLVMTKRWLADGTVATYDDAKNFKVKEYEVSSLADLNELIEDLQANPHVCIIRGKFKGEDVARTLVTQDREDYWPKKNPLFDDVPHHWMMTDIDKWVSPTGIDPILNPVDAIQEWISICLPEEFHDKSFIWHLSSSAGHESNKGVLKAHIFHWLATPYTGSQLTAWARGLGIPLDVSVLRRVQAHFIAAPIFDPGVADPVPSRSGFHVDFEGDTVNLTIDDVLLARAHVVEDEQGKPDPRLKPGLIGAFCRAYTMEELLDEFLPGEFTYVTDTRITWNSGGGSPEGAFVDETGEYLTNTHNTDPALNRSCNKWDLVRIHKFGHLDSDIPPEDIPLMSVAQLPSHIAMVEFVETLDQVEHAADAHEEETIKESIKKAKPAKPYDLWSSVKTEPFSEGLLPPVLENLCIERACLAGADPAGYALAALVTAAGSINTGVRVQPNIRDPQWTTPTILWGAVVADSGAGKTPAISTATRPIRDFNMNLVQNYAMQMATYEEEKEQRKKGDPVLDKPTMQRRFANDVTLEKVTSIMADDSTGLLMSVDELYGMFAGANQYKSSGNDLQVWLSAWNGEPYLIDRISRGTLALSCWGPSLIGGIQPSRLAEVMKVSVDDGMIPRFLMVKMQDEHRLPKMDDDGDTSIVDEYEACITRLLSMNFTGKLRFSFEAQALIDAEVKLMQTSARRLMQQLPPYFLHMQKCHTFLARIAATMHMVQWASEGYVLDDEPSLVIDKETAEMAIRFYDWTLVNLHALCLESNASKVIDLATRIAAFIAEEDRGEAVTRREIHHHVYDWKKSDTFTKRAAIEYLADCDWLFDDVAKKNRRGMSFGDASAWFINPEVAIYRDLAKEMREKSRELVAGLSKKVSRRNVDDVYEDSEGGV